MFSLLYMIYMSLLVYHIPLSQYFAHNVNISLDWPLTQFGFFGPASCCTSSFCVVGPVLSSPARGSPSLAMAQRRIEVVFVLWDDLKLTSGLRTPTAFNGHFFSKMGESKVLDEYYNSYIKR
jgi:hypothetical protein